MLKTDFVHVFADAIQWHEGWLETAGAAYPNLNPGNLEFAHQNGAVPNGRFAKFPDFFTGKQAQLNDIFAKLPKHDTIRSVISVYAPPIENNTEAYISSVVAYFNAFGYPIDADSSISQFIAISGKPVILLVINQIWHPIGWTAIQQTIKQLAKYMPNYAFSCRYSNAYLGNAITTIQNANPPGGFYSGVSGDAVRNIIAPYNQGQALNVMIYDGSIMQGHPIPYGGCEFRSVTEPNAPISAVSAAMYNGAAFVDPLVRVIFHELIHELFDLTNQLDITHSYLIAHGGYTADLATDLEAVFTGNDLNTPAAIANLKQKEINNL